MNTLKVKTTVGEFTRTTNRPYVFVSVWHLTAFKNAKYAIHKDTDVATWHMTEAAAKRQATAYSRVPLAKFVGIFPVQAKEEN